jgi:DNA-binding beta-propeller fold protein YncE
MTISHLAVAIACILVFPKTCHWEPWEPWDDPDQEEEDEDENDDEPYEECTSDCHEPCSWDVDALSFPINVWMGQAVLGEIAFDGNCDLIVGGGEELPYADALYRVNQVDGSVAVAVAAAELPNVMISGITYRASDNRIYFAAGSPDQLYALDDQDQLASLLMLDDPISSLTVAPVGFGDFGDQLIAVTYAPAQLLAIDVETLAITAFAQSNTLLSVAAFGPDGTLYVAEYGADRISTVTADGVFTPFFTGLDAPDGLAISPDGTRMFVAHLEAGGRIDQISIPDATLTPGISFELSTGLAPTGIVVDGANHVLFEKPLNNYAVVDVFAAP